MNSILQCIQHIDPLTQYFLKGDYQKDVNKNNPLGSGGRVGKFYQFICLRFCYADPHHCSALSPLCSICICFLSERNMDRGVLNIGATLT